MKLNILKLYNGGGLLFSAVADPSSNQAVASRSGASDKSSDKKESLISDTILNKLMSEALPNDTRRFMNMLSDLEEHFEKTGRVSKRRLYDVRTYANLCITQSDAFKAAENKAIENKAWDEIAVDSRGYLYTIGEDGIKKTRIQNYNKEKQQALTYGQLSLLRRDDDSLVDRSDITTVLRGGIGIEKINDYILSIISKVGSSETSQEAYENLISIVGSSAKAPNSMLLQAIRGIAQQLDTLGEDAIFKLKTELESKNILAGFQYILSVLPNNVKNQLAAHFVVETGADPKDINKNIGNLILSALQSANDTKYLFGINYDTSLNKASETKSGKKLTQGKEDLRRLTTTEMFFNLNLNQTTVTISDPSYENKYALEAEGSVISSLTLDSGVGAGTGALSDVLNANGKGMGKYLDMNKIWLGKEQVSEFILNKLYYRGDLVANVWLPVDSNQNLDWLALYAFADAEKEIKAHNITDVNTKNKIHALHGSTVSYNQDGTLNKNRNVAQFLMTHIYTTDDYVSSDNTMYKDLKRADEKLFDEEIKTVNGLTKSSLETSGIFDDILKLPVFIKIQPNAGVNAAYYARQGSQVPDYTLEQDLQQQLASQQPQKQIYSSSSVLYN